MSHQAQVALQVPATAGYGAQLYSGGGRIVWHAFKESTGSAAAEYDIYDGSSSSGPLLLPVTLSSGQSTRDSFQPHGLEFHNGLYVTVTSGTVRGDIVIVPEERWDDWSAPRFVINIPFDELATFTGQ